MSKTTRAIKTICVALILGFVATANAVTEIKIATVAPRGSMWMRIFDKMKARILKDTNGEVSLRFYPGQVQGDERDVVRKMRTGQLHGGAFTSVGLSMINPQVLILQMPLLFKNYEQLDKVRKALKTDFEKSFREKGYEFLGWGDLGWIYLFTNNKVEDIVSLKKQKVWVWNDDPLSKAFFREIGVSPRLLGLPQVLPALNTGIIDAVYNSPLGCMALQWQSKVKFVGETPVAIGIGALVITKNIFDQLKPEHQTVLKNLAEKYNEAMSKRIREDNIKALEALKNGGLQTVPVSSVDMEKLREVAQKVMRSFSPRYYPEALMQKVVSAR
ncbi:MAG: TRAP transporter substrate-binding protein DctP [Pseudomonadota bacterium]